MVGCVVFVGGTLCCTKPLIYCHRAGVIGDTLSCTRSVVLSRCTAGTDRVSVFVVDEVRQELWLAVSDDAAGTVLPTSYEVPGTCYGLSATSHGFLLRNLRYVLRDARYVLRNVRYCAGHLLRDVRC